MSDVFLSYSHRNSDAMKKVVTTLLEVGLSVWNDEHLEPGTEAWSREIEKEIRRAGCLVVLLSSEAAESQYVRLEIQFANLNHKKIFPILISGDEKDVVPLPLIEAQWIDLRPPRPYDNAMENLTRAIFKLLYAPLSDAPKKPITKPVSPSIDPIKTSKPVEIPSSLQTNVDKESEKQNIVVPPPPPPSSSPWLLIVVLATVIIGGIFFVSQNRLNNNTEPTARSTLTIAPTTTSSPRCTPTPTPDPNHSTLVAQENLTAIAQTPSFYATLRAQETSTAVARIPSAHATFVAQETATAASLAITPC